jgi:hypothetical protein
VNPIRNHSGRLFFIGFLALALTTALIAGAAAAQDEAATGLGEDIAPQDIVQNDDLIVEGRVCASDSGLCADGETFDPGPFNPEFFAKDSSQPGMTFYETGSGVAWGLGVSPEDGIGFAETNAASFPFQVLTGAIDNTLVVAPDRRVGIGTLTPDALLEVTGGLGQAMIRVDENYGVEANRFLLRLENHGAPKFSFLNSASNDGWQFSMDANNHFIIDYMNTGGQELQIRRDGTVKMGPSNANNFFLDPSGNLTIAGALTQNSDVLAKTEIEPIDTAAVLQEVVALPLFTWRYQDSEGTHLGPMAQDFYAAFGLGVSETGISTLDTSGVALASIQSLHQLAQDQAREIDSQAAYIADLEERIAALEAAVRDLADN